MQYFYLILFIHLWNFLLLYRYLSLYWVRGFVLLLCINTLLKKHVKLFLN